MKGVGLLVLSTDPVGEDAFKTEMAGLPVRVFTTRISYDVADHAAGGFKPTPDWGVALATLPAGDLVDLIAFSCTSATIALGNDELLHQLSSARPSLRYTSPAIATVEMLNRFNLKRIALLSPYAPALHDAFTPYFASHGIEVVVSHSLNGPMNIVTDDDVAHVSVDRMEMELKALLDAGQPVDALFVSCAAFSISKSDLGRLTRTLGHPVLASVSAMAWHTLDLLGEQQLREELESELAINDKPSF